MRKTCTGFSCMLPFHFSRKTASHPASSAEQAFPDHALGKSITLSEPSIISIQSQVAYGHVGNSAAVFPMQMHGIDVIAVPTTLLSNRPGYPTIRGQVLDARLVADLLIGIEERGVLDDATMILSGYLGSTEIADVVADFVERAR